MSSKRKSANIFEIDTFSMYGHDRLLRKYIYNKRAIYMLMYYDCESKHIMILWVA